MIGVGGSLDLLVGERRRAPTWMQRSGTEWIARLAQEPGRLGGRYAHDLRVFGPRLAREWREVRARRNDTAIVVATNDHSVDVRIGGSTEPRLDAWRAAVGGLAEGAGLRLRSGSATSIGDRSLAMLIGLVRQAQRRNADVRWLDDPSRLTAALRARGIPPGLIAAP